MIYFIYNKINKRVVEDKDNIINLYCQGVINYYKDNREINGIYLL